MALDPENSEQSAAQNILDPENELLFMPHDGSSIYEFVVEY